MSWHLDILVPAACVSLAMTPVARAIGRRFRLLDHPQAGLKDHTRAVPNVGGVVIVMAALLPAVVARPWPDAARMAGVLAGAAILLLLGIVDDRRPLSSTAKLPVQILAAVIACACGVRTTIEVLPPFVNAILTVGWIVGIANAVNIIDIMDGLAAGVAGIAALAFYALAVPAGDPAAGALAAGCVGACAGFLPYNWPPASIFMGDAGSGALGFLLACSAVMLGYSAVNEVAVLGPLLILAVPIYDTALVVYLRAWSGRPVMQGSRDHCALRLVAMGFSRRGAVLMAYAVSLATGAISLALVQMALLPALIVLGGVTALLVVAGVILAKADVGETGPTPPGPTR